MFLILSWILVALVVYTVASVLPEMLLLSDAIFIFYLIDLLEWNASACLFIIRAYIDTFDNNNSNK